MLSPGVVEILGGHRQLESRSDDRTAALELLERDADTGVEQSLERTFDSVLSDEVLHVSELDSGVLEEPPVGTRRARVHAVLENLEEAPLPIGEGVGDPLPCLRRGHRRSKESRQVDGVTSGERESLPGAHRARPAGRNFGSVTSSVTSSKTTSTGMSHRTSSTATPSIVVGSRGPSSSSTTATM